MAVQAWPAFYRKGKFRAFITRHVPKHGNQNKNVMSPMMQQLPSVRCCRRSASDLPIILLLIFGFKRDTFFLFFTKIRILSTCNPVIIRNPSRVVPIDLHTLSGGKKILILFFRKKYGTSNRRKSIAHHVICHSFACDSTRLSSPLFEP